MKTFHGRTVKQLILPVWRVSWRAFCLSLIAGFIPASCHRLDDDRIPPMAVNLVFNTVAEWNTYGLGGAMDWARFIREERIPSNYPYTALSYTGFGGLLLLMDVYGAPRAYDLACPVECRSNVRVTIDKESMLAECPECHSTYDVFTLAGYPVSGTAAERGYGLKVYYVGPGRSGEYMVVSY